jgi:hypothetical protein
MEAQEIEEKIEEMREDQGSRSTNLRIGLLIAALARCSLCWRPVANLLRPKPSTRMCGPPISGPSYKRKRLE